jgi:ketosteroid isomerase-like protein
MGVTEAEDVRAAIDEMIDALNTGDAGRLSAQLPRRPGAVHIGTDPDE